MRRGMEYRSGLKSSERVNIDLDYRGKEIATAAAISVSRRFLTSVVFSRSRSDDFELRGLAYIRMHT